MQLSDFDAAEKELERSHQDVAGRRLVPLRPRADAEAQGRPAGRPWRKCKKSIDLDPTLVDAYYTFGITLWQQGEFPEAVKKLKKAIELKPDYAEAYYTLGTVLKQMNQLPEAAELHCVKRFACSLLSRARIPRWRRCCDRWATPRLQSPKRSWATRWSSKRSVCRAQPSQRIPGKRMLDAGDLDGAISQFRTRLSLRPNLAAAHYQLSMALSRKGEKPRQPRRAASVQKSWIPKLEANP